MDTQRARHTDAPAAVVIDVLRAFTTSPWLFARGTSRLWLARDDAAALRLKQRLVVSGTPTVAINNGVPTPGFDFGNSPGQARRRDLSGRDVVQRTTNGTRSVLALGLSVPIEGMMSIGVSERHRYCG